MSKASTVLGRLQRLSLILGKSLGVILLISLLATGWLIGTETGSRWLLQTALPADGRLTVDAVEGTLLHRLELSRVRFQDGADFSVSADRIEVRWNAAALLRGRLHIQSVQLRDLDVRGRPTPDEEPQGGGTIPRIPLQIDIDRFDLERLQWSDGDSRQTIEQLTFRATLNNNRLSLSGLDLSLRQWHVAGNGDLQLQTDWPLTVSLGWSYREDGSVLEGRLSLVGNTQRYAVESRVEGAAESRQQGFVSLAGTQPQFDLSGSWQKLRWPLSGSLRIGSRRGEFRIAGTPQQYRSELNAELAAPGQPDVSAVFSGHGGLDSIAVERLLLKPAQGQLELSGFLSWAEALTFDLALNAQRLNPADFGTGVPGRMDMQAAAQGRIEGEQYRAQVNIERLHGTLYDQPLSAAGKIKLAEGQLTIDRLEVSAGNNRLEAAGRLTEQHADIVLDIAAPNLRSAWPTLAGSLHGKAALKGALDKPAITASLRGRNLRFADNRIGDLALAADYEHLASRPSRLEFSAGNIRLAENRIDRVSLQVDGDPERHVLQLDIDSGLLNLQARTNGQWNGKRWQGTIARFDIEPSRLKLWRLQAPATLSLSESGGHWLLELPDSCLQQDDARLCLSANGSPGGQLDGSLSLTDWPLAAAQPWLAEELALSGPLSARGRFSSTAGDLEAELKIELPQGAVRYRDEDNVDHEQAFNIDEAHVAYHHDRLEGRFRLALGQQDSIGAEITAGAPGPLGSRNLNGALRARIVDLQLFDGLLPDIDRLEGALTAELAIAGNSELPVVSGNAQWSDGQFAVPRLGAEFRNINVSVQSTADSPERLLLTAALESGEGRMKGHGHLDLLPNQGFPLQLDVTGEQFRLVRLPEAEIAVSPTLTIHKQGHLTKIDGLIAIDRAKVELKTLPESAIAPSTDEIVIDANRPQHKVIDPSRLQVRVDVDFGADSRFEGFGLKTRLSGKLHYIVDEERQSMLGRALMQDATYRAYGQDLTIRKGEFVFNGPADNPWLTVEAIRKAVSDDVTAVLRVTGPLKSPQTKVFTEPSLPESEALSYLVTGKSTQWLGKSEGNAVAGAAFNYGAGQLSWLSDRLGIDEFEFEQGEKISDSAVRLGQYLNPDLYLGVTMGLFSNTYAADIKYRLSKHFSINTRAGETQRIDLKYHLETD